MYLLVLPEGNGINYHPQLVNAGNLNHQQQPGFPPKNPDRKVMKSTVLQFHQFEVCKVEIIMEETTGRLGFYACLLGLFCLQRFVVSRFCLWNTNVFLG